MLKRLFLPALFAITIFLSGCSSSDKVSDDKLQIVTTIFPAYDFARQVFGDTAEVTLLLKPGMESHSFDPSARDIVKIENCDLFIYNGGESDVWVDNILKSTENVNALRMMDAVEALEEDHEGIAEIDPDDHDHEEDEYDEHIWTSPKNAALIIYDIYRAAISLAPQNKELYKNAGEEYIADITDLDGKFAELLSGEKRYFVFGDRFPLLYFFREYELNYYAAFPGCGSETEPSAQTIAMLAEKLSEGDTVPTVFCIELSNRKLAQTLADENGLSVSEFHTCHNITADDFGAGESYVSLMERNYQMLQNVLAKGE